MLIKHSSPIAHSARFSSPEYGGTTGSEVKSAEPGAPVKPSAEQIEILELRQKRDDLSGELSALRADWDTALAGAEARAKDAAAGEHVKDDQARLTAISQSLDKARDEFDGNLRDGLGGMATNLAGEALARLVKLRGPDGDWLARTIARRLGEVRAGAIVALHVSPHDLSDELIAMVRPALPGGTLIAADQALKSGTARLGLRLGQIEIDPALGLAQVLALLDDRRSDA